MNSFDAMIIMLAAILAIRGRVLGPPLSPHANASIVSEDDRFELRADGPSAET